MPLAGLVVAAAAALWLTAVRGPARAAAIAALRATAALAVVVQLVHCGEEYRYAFYQRFPELLGFAPWPASFFVAFNAAWIVVWLASLALLGAYPRGAAFPLWFLAIAATANGVVHPLLSVVFQGYFPGLWTSPGCAVAGVLLLRAMVRATGVAG